MLFALLPNLLNITEREVTDKRQKCLQHSPTMLRNSSLGNTEYLSNISKSKIQLRKIAAGICSGIRSELHYNRLGYTRSLAHGKVGFYPRETLFCV